MLSIREQIKARPKSHRSLFTCCFFGIVTAFIDTGVSASFIAAAFVILVLIDIDSGTP